MKKGNVSTLDILWAIRDSHCTVKAERVLLEALVMRGSWKEGRYECWPSYALLVKDTQCCLATLKASAKTLEQRGLLLRHHRTNQVNVFRIAVNTIMEQAAIQREADQAEKDLEEGMLLNNHDRDQEGFDVVAATDAPEQPENAEGSEGILLTVQRAFEELPWLLSKACQTAFAREFGKMVKLAGSPLRLEVLFCCIGNDASYLGTKTKERMQNVRKPVPYILACLPSWLKEYDTAINNFIAKHCKEEEETATA